MRKGFYSEIHTGTDGHASRLFSLLETMHIENEEMDGKARTESGIWTWKVHEVALHEASQGEGPLKFDRRELLLKQVSEEVTRKVQEKLRAARSM
jgi:hypothetical protein